MLRVSFWTMAVLFTAISFVVFFGALDAASSDEGEKIEMSQEKKIEFDLFSDYFVRNDVKPFEGKESRTGFLDCASEFEKIFGPARVMNSTQVFLPDDYFDAHEIVYYAEWGDVPWDYAVRRVKRDGETLIVKVTKTGEPSQTATFTSPLILGFSRSDLTDVKTLLLDFIPADAAPDAEGTLFPIRLKPCRSACDP